MKNRTNPLMIGLILFGFVLVGTGSSGCNTSTDPDTGAADTPDTYIDVEDAETGSGEFEEDVPVVVPDGDPPSAHIQELLDILRTADHSYCQRSGEGWPLGECPRGCMFGKAPRFAVDAERDCRLTDQQLGGPVFCIPDMESGYWDCSDSYEYCYCSDFERCFIHTESDRVILAETSCGYIPEAWNNWGSDGRCGDLLFSIPQCTDEEE